MLLLPTLLLYALGLLLTGIGSRLASRCATWCGALCGLPMWMVGGTLVAVCTALPQLVLAFLAAGMSVTALAVGTALAGAVTQLGLVLALCLLRALPVPRLVFLACMLPACAPTAANAVMFAEKFGGDTDCGARIISISTLLSALSMPLLLSAAQMVSRG